MTTIAEAAAAVTAAIGLTKELVGVNKALSEAEFKLKIAELSSALAAAQMGMIDVQKTIVSKDAEIEDLKKSFAFRQELVEKNGFKYRKKDAGGPTGSAFCPRCEEADKKFYQLTTLNKAGRPYGCPNCKAEYMGNVTEYR